MLNVQPQGPGPQIVESLARTCIEFILRWFWQCFGQIFAEIFDLHGFGRTLAKTLDFAGASDVFLLKSCI